MFIVLTKISSVIVSAIQVEKELPIGSCLLYIHEKITHHKNQINMLNTIINRVNIYLFILFFFFFFFKQKTAYEIGTGDWSSDVCSSDLKRDSFNILVGIVWQMAQVVIPIYFMLRENTEMVIWSAILILTSYLLKKFWWDNLKNIA